MGQQGGKGETNERYTDLEGKERGRLCAGGSIGAAVAREFAKEGATIFLAGRTKASLEVVAKKITESGSTGQTAVVDTLNDAAVAFVDCFPL